MSRCAQPKPAHLFSVAGWEASAHGVVSRSGATAFQPPRFAGSSPGGSKAAAPAAERSRRATLNHSETAHLTDTEQPNHTHPSKGMPSQGRAGAVRPNRKGSCRPACHWCFVEPVQELGPARADPVSGGVRRREATGNDPAYEIAHLPFDRAARLRFRNVPGCRGRVVFSAKTMSGLLVLARRSAPKTSPRQKPNENRVPGFIPVSYEAASSVTSFRSGSVTGKQPCATSRSSNAGPACARANSASASLMPTSW